MSYTFSKLFILDVVSIFFDAFPLAGGGTRNKHSGHDKMIFSHEMDPSMAQ